MIWFIQHVQALCQHFSESQGTLKSINPWIHKFTNLNTLEMFRLANAKIHGGWDPKIPRYVCFSKFSIAHSCIRTHSRIHSTLIRVTIDAKKPGLAVYWCYHVYKQHEASHGLQVIVIITVENSASIRACTFAMAVTACNLHFNLMKPYTFAR